MKLNDFFVMLDNKLRTDYIVRLKYKYEWEKEYTIENEYLEYDGNNDNWIWLNDWNEGQTDIEVLGYIAVEDVDVPTITSKKENNMEEYWKLLDLDNGEYSTHETEEEVNHIIDYLTRDMNEDKEIIRKDIETPFNNYDFQSIVVVDSYKVRRFFYFFDTIEEQCDDYEERVQLLQAHRESNQLDMLKELQKQRDGLKRTCEAKDAYISNLQIQISNLVERNRELNDRIQSAIKAKSIALEEMDNLRKELKFALEALHDQYDESDKPCCKKCVHCRPFVGSTDCYCSQTGELIKNKYAETYYCKEMIPYEDDYDGLPF